MRITAKNHYSCPSGGLLVRLAAPWGTPPEIITQLNAETRHIFEDAAFGDSVLAPNFIFSIVSTPDAFAAGIRSEWAKSGEVIRDTGLKAE